MGINKKRDGSYYDVMQVCENGHFITDNYYSSYTNSRKSFCTRCGAKTRTTCPNCNKEIQGEYHVPGVIVLDRERTPVPNICQYCGNDFPWRSNKKKEVKTKIAEAFKEGAKSLILKQICTSFHLVARQLRQRYKDRPTLDITDEYDTQDLFHALLKLFFEDIRPEEWTPSYAGKASRTDFLIKKEKLVIEIKKTRPSLKAKQLGDQLIIDIARYQVHPDCQDLLCFVYDPDGYINNPTGIENDLSGKKDGINVTVLITPKGH